jgi:DNA-binding GntR family transcriptional regulator
MSVSAKKDEPLFGQTLAERTADEIRRRILALAPGFRPGERLFPLKLAEDLGVSSTPIREALGVLAAEKLVEMSPRRGASVVRFSAAEIDDLVAVRCGLEVLAIRFNGGRIQPDEARALSTCLDECERAIEENDIPTWREKDGEFHRLLVSSSRSPRLVELYETLRNQAEIMLVHNPRHAETLRESLAEHRELVRQLAQGDARRSEAALLDHWERSKARLHLKYDEYIRPDAPDGSQALERPSSAADQVIRAFRAAGSA